MQVAVRAPATGEQHHIDTIRERQPSRGLPEQALRPVALDRTADTPRRDDTDTRSAWVIVPFTCVEHDKIAGTLPATPEHRADVAPVPEPFVGRRAHALRPRAWSDRGGDAG